MLPYWFLFFLAAYFASAHLRATVPLAHDGHWSAQWRMMFVLLVLMIGLRHEVGGDWSTYLENLDMNVGVSLGETLLSPTGDPASRFLEGIGAYWGGVYLVNTICAAVFSWGLVVFCRAQPFPWLSLVVAIPYLVIVVAMGYTRQGAAIGLAMLALVALGKGRALHFVLWIAVAALFHKSVIILAPMAVLAATKRKLWTVTWVCVAAGLLFVLLLRESVENLALGYLAAEYQSSGAGIRIAMNALPAMLFLSFRRRFALPKEQQSFWTWMALGALMFVGLLYVSPSSTAVDRVALYWIPLQLFVWSRLPNALGRRSKKKTFWISLVVGYSAAVQFVWLMFAATAFAWLPYQFFPWAWLWQ